MSKFTASLSLTSRKKPPRDAAARDWLTRCKTHCIAPNKILDHLLSKLWGTP